jgi:hypothetical protein
VISFRFHLVSLVAAFLALAVGVVVGATALNGPVTHDLRQQISGLKSDKAALASKVGSLSGQVQDAGEFATTYGARLVKDTLKGQKVLLLALPGTPTGMQDALSAQLNAAGATLTGRLQLAGRYLDPAESQNLTDFATGPAHPLGLQLPESGDPARIAATLLAYVLAGKGKATDVRTVLTGLAGLHMLTSDPSAVHPARTVLVAASGSLPKATYAGQAQLDLVSALAGAGASVVVAGDVGSAAGNGVIALVRGGAQHSTVSTVDDADTAVGTVSAVLALAAQKRSDVGQYGSQRGATALFPAPPG